MPPGPADKMSAPHFQTASKVQNRFPGWGHEPEATKPGVARRQPAGLFMEIGPKSLASGGSIPQDRMIDGLHPADIGCAIRSKAVRGTLVKTMQ